MNNYMTLNKGIYKTIEVQQWLRKIFDLLVLKRIFSDTKLGKLLCFLIL